MLIDSLILTSLVVSLVILVYLGNHYIGGDSTEKLRLVD